MPSSTAARFAWFLWFALAGCANAAADGEPAVPGQARASRPDRPAPQTSAEEDTALDRGSRRSPRSSTTIATQIQRLERRLARSPSFATDRAELLRRLADGYAELEAALKAERASPEDVKKARDKAIERYEQLQAEHPKSDELDDALYDLALAYMRSGDLARARETLLALMKQFPKSPLLARAKYAYGIVLREEAGTDPAKKELARKAFGEAAQESKPGDPIHRLAVAEKDRLAPAQVVASGPPTPAPRPTTSEAASASASAPAPAPTTAEQPKLGTDGTYVAEGGNYRLEAKFEAGKIIVTEPNKVSVYQQQGSSRVHSYTDSSSKIEYLLEIAPDGKTLFAFKPATPNNRTRLSLDTSVPNTGKCKAGLEEIPVENDAAVNPNKERLWGTPDRNAVAVAGTYLTEGGHPKIVLPPTGTGGVFEMHGAPKEEHVYELNRWWLQANCDGSLIFTTYPAAKVYWIVVEFKRPYQGMKYKRYGVQVRSDRTVILDRVKQP